LYYYSHHPKDDHVSDRNLSVITV